MVTVLIDDSGWGDLIGGVVISCYRPEEDLFVYRVIDVKFFQDPFFSEKRYLQEASDMVQDMLFNSLVLGNEEIIVCTGYVLSKAVSDLMGKVNVKTGKIEGKLQELGENAYLAEIKKLGYEPIPGREVNRGMRARSFYHMLNWLKEKPERFAYAKTGWGFFHPERPKKTWGRRDDYD